MAKNEHGDGKDDWTINNDEQAVHETKLLVPSFIRLFVINRIIFNGNSKTTIDDLIGECMKDDEASDEFNARKILSSLKKLGIKKYMSQSYSDTFNSVTIEMIFNSIILNKYEKEYNKLTTYNDNNNNGKYKQLVFNTNDLMSNIFQYLEYRLSRLEQDLSNCSLVNSHWGIQYTLLNCKN